VRTAVISVKRKLLAADLPYTLKVKNRFCAYSGCSATNSFYINTWVTDKKWLQSFRDIFCSICWYSRNKRRYS